MNKLDNKPKRCKGRIMIIDDEPGMGRILSKSLAMDGFESLAYTEAAKALDEIDTRLPDVILTDVRMPGMDGHEVLARITKDYPEIPVLIMTAYGTIEHAVKMLKAGAYNYIAKPFQHDSLVHQIERALEHRLLIQENSRLSDQDTNRIDVQKIIGSSTRMEHVREMISKAAQTVSAVLITGESGVGKELVARAIHDQSPRNRNRFVTVNCPAIPPTLIESEMFGYERGAFTGADRPKMGLIELSNEGTFFLDEIAEIPNELQVKLLRVIQEHEVHRIGGLRTIELDLRFIAATNRDLEVDIEANRFRMDLYYRLNVIPIVVPPLRERAEDIPELVEYFLKRIARRTNRPGLDMSASVIHFFQSYPWPGNIRELGNTLERMAVMSSERYLTESEIPPDMLRGTSRTSKPAAETMESGGGAKRPWPKNFKEARQNFERSYLEQLLRDCKGNASQAARVSGISRRSLYEKFEKLGMTKDSFS